MTVVGKYLRRTNPKKIYPKTQRSLYLLIEHSKRLDDKLREIITECNNMRVMAEKVVKWNEEITNRAEQFVDDYMEELGHEFRQSN